MRVNAVLHIGMEKCGSSALQTALSHNPTVDSAIYGTLQYCQLNKKGSIAPVYKYGHLLPNISHGYFVSSPAENFSLDDRRLQESRATIERLSRRGGVILSHENWARTLPFFEQAGLLETLGLNAHVVAYVRPPVEWINSAWWQWGAWAGREFNDWLHEMIAATQWSRILSPWQHTRCVASLSVRLSGSDVIADFCELVAAPALQPMRRNIGLPGEILRFMQNHPQFRNGPHDATNDHLFANRLRAFQGSPSPWVLNREQMQVIVDETRASNLALLSLLDQASKAAMHDDPRWWKVEAFDNRRVEDPNPVSLNAGDLDKLAVAALQAVVEMHNEAREPAATMQGQATTRGQWWRKPWRFLSRH